MDIMFLMEIFDSTEGVQEHSVALSLSSRVIWDCQLLIRGEIML